MLSKLLILLIAGVAASGCLSPPQARNETENPIFAVTILDAPAILYEDDPLQVKLRVEHVHPKKEIVSPTGLVDRIGEAGTHPACVSANATLRACQDVSLIPGENKTLAVSLGTLPIGVYTLTTRNDTRTLAVRPTPQLGDWINATALHMRLDAVSHPNATWEFSASIRYPLGLDVVNRVGLPGHFDARGKEEVRFFVNYATTSNTVAATVQLAEPWKHEGTLFRWRL